MLDHTMRYKLQFFPQMVIDLDHFSEDEVFDYSKTKKEQEEIEKLKRQLSIKEGSSNKSLIYDSFQEFNKSQISKTPS